MVKLLKPLSTLRIDEIPVVLKPEVDSCNIDGGLKPLFIFDLNVFRVKISLSLNLILQAIEKSFKKDHRATWKQSVKN